MEAVQKLQLIRLPSMAISWLLVSLRLVMVLDISAAAPAMFIFGDSLVDVGNNDFIPSLARANFPPNGIDLPSHKPTGRFCNGKLISDFLSDYMKTPPVKAYLDPTNDAESLLLGSNFASAGAGILNSTGRVFVSLLTVEKQFEYFQEYKAKISSLIGAPAVDNLVKNGLFSVTFGGNDFINNYLMPLSRSKRAYTYAQFQDILISTYRQQLIEIYNLGARKLVITGLGPLGCIPSQLTMKSQDGSCIPSLQQVAINFNGALKAMLEELNAQLTDATYVYTNSFDMVSEYINNPQAYGFDYGNVACCGQGKYNGQLICNPLSSVCEDRTKYVFWDPYHPTERMNQLISNRVLNGPPSDISPVNLRALLGI